MKISHFMVGVLDPGGVATYIKKVAGFQAERGDKVLLFDHVSRKGDDKEGVTYISNAMELFGRCIEQKVDVVHLHLSLPLRTPPPLPTVRTVHGHAPFCPAGTQFLQRSAIPCPHTYSARRCLVNHLVERCGSVRPGKIFEEFQTTRAEIADGEYLYYTTVSEFMRSRMVRAGYSPDRITVNYLPAPQVVSSAMPISNPTTSLLYAGRLTRLKGVDWLISAMQNIQDNITLDVAGEGPERERLEQLVSAKNLTTRVKFHGWLDASALSGLYESCMAVVFPSLWHEPGGTVAFEAMAHSKPVVMSAVGGMPEVIIDGHNGIIVPPNDTVALIAAIRRIALDQNYAFQMGANGFRDVQTKFTLAQHMAVLDGVYAKCKDAGTKSTGPR